MQGIGGNTPMFRAYEDDYLKLDDRRIETAFLLLKGEVTAPWEPESLADIRPEHLQAVFDSPPEVLIIGTGRRTAFPDASVMKALDEAHIGFEFMDSRAAARTYNILAEEGRDTAVAMLLPGTR